MPTPRLDLSNTTPSKPAPRGRPNAQRAHEIRQLIIDVAAEIMLQHGFEGATLDVIASAAGVTKRTIYDRFGSKEALLREVLLNTARPARSAAVTPVEGANCRERLIAIATGMHRRWMDPRMQSWMRLAASEAAQVPHKVPVLQQALDDLHAYVEEILRAELGAQGAAVDGVTARVFTSMIAAPPQAHAWLGVEVGSAEQQKIYIERAVDMLLACMEAK